MVLHAVRQGLPRQQSLERRKRIRVGQIDAGTGRVRHRQVERERVFLQMGQDLVLHHVVPHQSEIGLTPGRGRIHAVALDGVVMDAGGVEGHRRDFVHHGRGRGQTAAQRLARQHQAVAEGELCLARHGDGLVVLCVLEAQSLAEVVLPVLTLVRARVDQGHIAAGVAIERGVEAALGVVQQRRVEARRAHFLVAHARPAGGQRPVDRWLAAQLVGAVVVVLDERSQRAIYGLRLRACETVTARGRAGIGGDRCRRCVHVQLLHG